MGQFIGGAILLVFVIGFFWFLQVNANATAAAERRAREAREAAAKAAQEALQKAQQDYQQSLLALKADPSNADLKQWALAYGRAYASMTREQNAVTIYDEMALSNDISAATAGATAPANVEQRLRQLEDLRTKGLVTDVEYAARRQQLIGEV